MRAFIIVCLFATAIAAPQGYNYQQNAFQFTGGSGSREAPSFLQEALQNTKLMQQLLRTQNSFAPAVAQSQYQAPQQQQQQPQIFSPRPQQQVQQHQQQYQTPSYHQQTQLAPIVTKDIYVHVAPEEPEEQHHQVQVPVAPPRKHYRIVFIKAPSPSINTAALRVNHAQTEEKTIIYVLTKKPDPIDLQAAFQDAAPKQPSKPEVYFIKYKTQEEAQHAQRTIQAQYDQLGGTTQISDEGVAPVTSVIGSLDQQQGSSGSSQVGGNSGFGISSNGSSSKYLPPITRI